ncbi:MAG: hypothetical protein ACHRHE_01540 [Tepidisphaerales bacterium]
MFKFVGFRAAWTLLVVAGWLTASLPIAGQIKPQFDRCTLELDGRIARVMLVNEARLEWVGDRRFVVRGDTVSELDANGGKILWSIKSADGQQLGWRGFSGHLALFVAFRAVGEGRPFEAESPGRVRRLDLAARKWIAPLVVSEEPPRGQREVVVDIRTGENRVAVLSHRTQHQEGEREDKVTAYRVSLFDADAEKAAWSRAYDAHGIQPEPVGSNVVWTATRSDYADCGIQRLTWIGERLLVCGGEKEDLICLDVAGKEAWRVPRIWEYQRGFLGPSMWHHYMERFGIYGWNGIMAAGENAANIKGEPPTPDQARQEERKRCIAVQKAFDEQYQCKIVGGPIVVAVPSPIESPQNIFVAVAKGPHQWTNFLGECIVYQLTGDGRVIAMATLPQEVTGGPSGIHSGAVIWGCYHSGMVRVDSQMRDGAKLRPPDGCLCNITWYRRIPAPAVKAWLEAGEVGQLLAMSPTHAFLTLSGGYIQEQGQHVYRFPITVVDLQTGAERIATLSVPFDGDLPLPAGAKPDDQGRIATDKPHVLGVWQMRTVGGRLELTLGELPGAELRVWFPSTMSRVWFDLEVVLGRPVAEPATRPATR